MKNPILFLLISAFILSPIGIAQTLPAPWFSQDIGNPVLGGSAAYSNGTFTIRGGGYVTANTWTVKDKFQFVYQSFSGNISITAKIDTFKYFSDWTKNGIMIRESLADSSKFVAVNVNPVGHQHIFTRTVTGGAVANNYQQRENFPRWYRLVRIDTAFTGYKSINGTDWTVLTPVKYVTMNSTVYVGMAVHSHVDTTLSEATFSNVNVGIPVSVNEVSKIPLEFELSQNYPNPFNPNTQFTYTIAKTDLVSLKVYDLLGREVAMLVNEVKPAGKYAATWKATEMNSGVYFYKMQAGSFVTTKKMVLMK